jgi:hypothetical protein
MKKRVIKVIRSHTGIILISGAACLKMGAMISSWPLLISGYGAFIGVSAMYIKKWRDHHDRQD